MLTSSLEGNGSAAYVAIERVIGTLNGRKGSFARHLYDFSYSLPAK